MVWDTVQPEQLVQAEPEQDLHGRRLPARASLAGNQPIQRGLPPHHPARKFLDQTPVRGRQPVNRQGGIQQVFDVTARGFPIEQDAKGNFSWFALQHLAILTVTFLEASRKRK